MSWLDILRSRYWSSTLGKGDISRWVGLLLLLALIYVSTMLPSELTPLPVLGTVPRSGATNVPRDTVLVVRFGANGLKHTFGDLEPVVVVRYDDEVETRAISTTVTYEDDVLWAVPVETLPPGRRVEAAARTQFGRDLIWYFTLTDESTTFPATPLPAFQRP